MYNISDEITRGVESTFGKTPEVVIENLETKRRVTTSLMLAVLGEVDATIDFENSVYEDALQSLQTMSFVVSRCVARLQTAIVNKATE